MKKVIRRNVWESNSSSCHALAISKDGLEPSQFKLDKEGYIHCDYGQFDEDNIYDTQYEKLSYLLTHAWYNSPCTSSFPEYIYDDCDFNSINDAVKEYIPKCRGIRIDMKVRPELNHQLQCENIINIWNKDEVINFVFNKHISLKIYHD